MVTLNNPADNKPCPCGSGKAYADCCAPYHQDRVLPQSAEALMRSRYSAFALQKIDYLKNTLWPKYQPGFDHFSTARWATENHWVGLKVLATEEGEAGDRQGTVLFEARYLAGGRLNTHRELSLFRKKSGRWYYVEALPEA
nr:YchJ family protein [uncultured Cohaesibacter sp.]